MFIFQNTCYKSSIPVTFIANYKPKDMPQHIFIVYLLVACTVVGILINSRIKQWLNKKS
jgi:hypothetical protein